MKHYCVIQVPLIDSPSEKIEKSTQGWYHNPLQCCNWKHLNQPEDIKLLFTDNSGDKLNLYPELLVILNNYSKFLFC